MLSEGSSNPSEDHTGERTRSVKQDCCPNGESGHQSETTSSNTTARACQTTLSSTNEDATDFEMRLLKSKEVKSDHTLHSTKAEAGQSRLLITNSYDNDRYNDLTNKSVASDVTNGDISTSWRMTTSPLALAIMREKRRRDAKYYRRKLALRTVVMLSVLGCLFGIVYAVVAVDWHADDGGLAARLIRTDPLPYQPIMGQGHQQGGGPGSSSHELGIMHGTDAQPGQYPWMVDLQDVDTGKSRCGGSLITPGWVLTAAHCVYTLQPADLKIVIGEHDISQPDTFEQVCGVRRFVIEPDFSTLAALPNDMALLELDTPATLNERVALIPVARNDSGLTECSVAGWGAAGVDPNTGMPIYPSVLQQVSMQRLGEEECRDRLVGYRISLNMTCAEGSDGAAVCWGDSGGSLSCRRPESGAAWTLVGITSWGIACGYLQYPSVYTRVSKFVPWLQNVTGLQLPPTI